MRSVGPQDRKALSDWVEYHSAAGDFDKFLNDLPGLPTGEAWVWSPEFLNLFKKVKIRERETFHPDREKLGYNFVMPKLEQTDIQAFIDNFQAEPEETQEDLIKDIETRAEKGIEVQLQQKDLEIERLRNELMAKEAKMRALDDIVVQIRKIVGFDSSISNDIGTYKTPSMANLDLWMSKLNREGQRKILKFLSEHPDKKFTRHQVALSTGQKYSTINKYIADLKRNLLVKEEGDRCFISPDL
jgi:hypothetical protein